MHTVVNIRGTSGSGKSTVARRVMDALVAAGHANVQERGMMGGKERITGHAVGPVFFLGKYATDCGGTDSMSWKGAADDVCALVREKAALGPVLFEGLMASSWGTGRLRDLWTACGGRVHVLQLTTSLEDCLASVQARRDAKADLLGKPRVPLNPENTRAKWHGARRGAELLIAAGVDTVEFLDREAAFLRARELLT